MISKPFIIPPSAFGLMLGVVGCISCGSPSEQANSFVPTRLPSQTISLTDLSAFQEAPANWSVEGSVYADWQQANALSAQPGTNVLVNLPEESDAANLFTSFEHGDIDLELDFMMAKSSNSGVYLQGRYEVQLFDSWGEDSVNFSDCGGIYQRWQDDRGYDGKAPRTNACYAPGLWQHLSIKFKAPRFDEQGNKIRDARFEEVALNGVVIHENVTVSGPTRSAAFQDEQPRGPLMLQGDHGPVAFRNIHFKPYGTERITLTDMKYQRYDGQFFFPDTLQSMEAAQSGSTDSISYLLAQQPEGYALAFSGTLTAPTSGDYLMILRSAGASWLRIDDQEVINHAQGERADEAAYGEVELEEGEHSFELIFSKPGQPWRQGLAWEYEGPEIPVTALQAPGSIPYRQPPPPHIVEVTREPVLQRGFWWTEGDKKTHTIAVGLPSEINYVYDLQNSTLLSAWGGKFVDATQMWDGRGEDQSLTPLGGVVRLGYRPSFAQLASSSGVWPDSVDTEAGTQQYAGYHLTDSGVPVFEYEWAGAQLQDRIDQQPDMRSLTRTIRVDFSKPESSWYCLLAEGSAIDHLPDGSYSIDDHRYYLTIESSSSSPLERRQGGREQLLMPLTPQNNTATLSYKIIW